MSAIDSASLNSFESLADLGTWLVIIGVAGEGVEIVLKVFQHRLKNKNFLAWCGKYEFWIEIWGAVFWLVVVIGLAMEFKYGHKAKTITDGENARLTQNAADLSLKAEAFRLKADALEQQMIETKTQLANAQANLIDLQNANLPMDIGNQLDFATKLVEFPETTLIKDLPRTPVKLRTLANDKAHKTATDLEIAFDSCRWVLVDRADIGEIGQSGIIIGYRWEDDLSEKAATLLRNALTAKNIPSKITTSEIDLRFEGIPTNGIMVVVCNRPDPLREKLMLVQAKQEELKLQPVSLEMKMWKLERQQFVIDSEEYRKALVEHNNLISQYTNTQNEITALNESEKQLKAEVDKAVFGTNSTFHISGLMRFDPATRTFGETVVR